MTTATTNRALGCLQRWSGAAEPGSVQRWQCHLVHTTIHYHRLPSLNCVLCNQLACSIIILQLFTWAVNSGQLCLNRPPPSPNHTVLKISQQQLSGSPQHPNNWTLRTKERFKIYFPITLRTMFSGKLGWYFPVACPLHNSTLFTHFLSFSTNWPPAWERGQQLGITDSKAILQCQKMYLAFFFLFKISAYKYS